MPVLCLRIDRLLGRSLAQTKQRNDSRRLDRQDIITFSDALTSVRYNAWDDYLFPHPMPRTPVEKLTARRKAAILNALALPA